MKMPRKRLFITKCEICGERASRTSHEKRKFMAKFPLDEARCRRWIKVVGKEDLIYVPIEKLHELKYVCGNHFESTDFNKKKNRLKRSAVPSKNLKADPLPDAMLLEFPCHVHSSNGITTEPYIPLRLCDNEDSLSQDEAAEPINSDFVDQNYSQMINRGHIDHDYIKCSKVFPVPELRALARPAGTGCTFPETNTFTLDPEVLADMHDLSDKIQNVYSTLLGKSFTVACRGVDDTNSEYVFSSSSDTRRAGEKHDGLNCCECRAGITGYRYKCVSCPDYDLCGACEALGAHSQHVVMRLSRPLKSRKARVFMRSICEAMKSAGISTLNDMLDGPAESSPQASGNTAQALSASADLTGHSQPDDPQASFQVLSHRPFVVKEEPMDEDETKTPSTPNNSNTTTAKFKENKFNVNVAKSRTKINKVVKREVKKGATRKIVLTSVCKKKTPDEVCKLDPLKNYYETFGENDKLQKPVSIISGTSLLKLNQKGFISSRPATSLIIQPQSVQPAAAVSQNSPVMGQKSPVMGQNSPVMGQNSPVMGQNSPVMGQNSPVMGQNSPVMGQNSPVMGQNSPVMGRNSPVMGQSETDRSLSGAAISPSRSSVSQMESIIKSP